MAKAWDAFISYARAGSGATADALQRGLERFARPWRQRRAIRVFRDDRAMSTNPALWPAIEQGLASARCLILLLTPAAAGSGYVDREVAWWVARKGADTILLVLDEGDLAWEDATGRFSAASTVPPSLVAAFAQEPRWLDLRWFGGGPDDIGDPRFAEALADLSAPIRGVDRDELIGEDLVQHRRVRRLARAAVVALTGLLVVSVVASVIAVRQRDDVLRQATSLRARQLASAATAQLPTDLRLAQLLAVDGFRTEDSPATRRALLETAVASPYLDHVAALDAPVRAIATVADGRTVVAGLADGRVVAVGTLTGATPRLRLSLPAAATTLRASDDGGVVLAALPEALHVADVAGTRRIPTGPQLDHSAAMSGSGRRAAVVLAEGDRPLVVYDTASGREVARFADPFRPSADAPTAYAQFTDRLAFPDEHTLRLVANDLRWLDLDLATGATTGTHQVGWRPYARFYATSPRGDFLLAADLTGGDRVEAWPLEGVGGRPPITAPGQLSDVLDLAISPDGSRVLASDAAGLLASPATTGGDGSSQWRPPASRIPGLSGIIAAAILAGAAAVAAVASGLVFLDLTAHGRGVSTTALKPRGVSYLAEYAVDSRNSAIAASPDGARLAVLERSLGQLEVVPLLDPAAPALPTTALDYGYGPAPLGPLWLDDDTVLVVDSEPGGPVPGLPRGIAHWHLDLPAAAPDAERAAAVAAHAGDGTVLVAASDGTLQTREARTGRLLAVSGAGSAPSGFELARFSPDGRYLAQLDTADTADDLDAGVPVTLRVVEVATGAVAAEHSWPSGTLVAGIEFAGGTLVVSQVDGSADLLSVPGGGTVRRVSSAGTRTRTGSGQATPPVAGPEGEVGLPTRTGLQLYDIATGQPSVFVPVPPGFEAEPRSYAFIPGDVLVTAYFGADPQTALVSVRPLAAEDLVRQSCASAGGALTSAERLRLVGGDPPPAPGCG
ncbi:MAG: toll/interleukin-1 receptor domain-containing protein [Propionicimonas sp.]